MKDFKRITLFLCTVDDFNMKNSFVGDYGDCFNDDMRPSKAPRVASEDRDGNSSESENISPLLSEPTPSTSTAGSSASWFLDEELNRLYGDGAIPNECYEGSSPSDTNNSTNNSSIENDIDIRNAVKSKVIVDGKTTVYIVVRRAASLNRVLCLWQRATTKVSPEHILREEEKMA